MNAKTKNANGKKRSSNAKKSAACALKRKLKKRKHGIKSKTSFTKLLKTSSASGKNTCCKSLTSTHSWLRLNSAILSLSTA